MNLRQPFAMAVLFVSYFSFFVFSADINVCSEDGGLVWQLGIANGKSIEFLPFKTKHFAFNQKMAKQPGWNQDEHSFSFTINKPGIDPNPLYPAGISGPTLGTSTWCQHQVITWKDDGEGWRMLEIPLLESHTYDFKRRHMHHAIEPDSPETWARYSLRITLPDGQITHTYLPYNLAAYEEKNGPVVVRAFFKAQKGKNALTLQETSGNSMFRNYQYDYIRVSKHNKPMQNLPTLEIETLDGFRHNTIYDWQKQARLKAKVYNLKPNEEVNIRLKFIDFFDNTVKQESKKVLANTLGQAETDFSCPNGITGHFRVIGELLQNDKPIKLQMGDKQTKRYISAIRTIAPLSDNEIEQSFIGLCGLAHGSAFDVYKYRKEYDKQDAVYRDFRRTLQIHNERFFGLPWNRLEPEENMFRWDYWDKIFAKEKEERIRLQVTVCTTPEWLLFNYYPERKQLDIHQKHWSCPPDLNKWADVCSKIAKRYRGQIADIELWNEPSEYSLFWYKATATDYFDLVKHGAEAIRKVAPEINIVGESIWAEQPEFYHKLYTLGIGKYIDYPAMHYMTDDKIHQRNRFLDQVNGRNKGLISNEAKSTISSRNGNITESERRHAARMQLRNPLFANANQVKRIYEFCLTAPSWRMWGYLGPTHEPRYSFAAFKTLINRTTGAEFYKSLNLGDKLEGYIYRYFDPRRIKENGGDNALFLFNLGTKPKKLHIYVNRPSVTVVDIMDNAREIKTENGMFVWELGENPIIVIGADYSALEKQAALSITPNLPSAKPGQTLNMEIKLSSEQKEEAEVKIDAGKLATAPQLIKVSSGNTVPVNIQLPTDIPEGVYPLDISAQIHGDNGVVPVFRRLTAVVSRIGFGENYFSNNTFSPENNEWKKWTGKNNQTIIPNALGKLSAAKVEVKKADSMAGVETVNPISIIPGARYHVMFRARGKGTIRLLQKRTLTNGKLETNENLINGKLTAKWKLYDFDWTAPTNIKYIKKFIVYIWHELGWFEVCDFRFIRIPTDLPVNRLLYTVAAKPTKQIKIDGKLDEWKDSKFTTINPNLGIRMNNYNGAEDLAVKFAAKWSQSKIYFAIIVDDNNVFEGDGVEKMWKGDSVQIDFEPDNRNTKSPHTQFCIGLIDSKPAVFRHNTIPTDEIIPSYVTGAKPDGVNAEIRREGKTTYYEIAVAARAIHPGLTIEKGKKIAFSLLVNDNDGSGRKGWMEWSSGIGSLAGTELFGTLKFE